MIELPKTIWIFWYQGFFEAPDFVKKCIFSWQFRNPNYQINILDKNSVHDFITVPDYITINRVDITHQKYANYIRLALLKKHGGVWVDANIYCFIPA